MKDYTFGEKGAEYSSIDKKELPVWISPKYDAAKEAAIKTIESGTYGITESDFWILMNRTKSGKMAYTGLILSHNGCLKINDSLKCNLKPSFSPSCVSITEKGYKDELVFMYCNEEQGLLEVGEVSASNCKNDYPYAMALKRCFDRVVLKLSKLAYSGIYSDSEIEPENKNDPKEKENLDKRTPEQKSAAIKIKIDVLAKARNTTPEKVTDSLYKICDKSDIDAVETQLSKWLSKVEQ